mgnify:FL=1
MERRIRRRLTAVLISCSVFVLLSAIVPTLTVRNASGTLLRIFPLGAGDSFIIRYTHSVARRPVREIFTAARDGGLLLRETTFDAFGAGLPFEPYDAERFLVERDVFRVVGMRRRFPSVTVRVGRVAEHALLLRGNETPLRAWEKPGGSLTFGVEFRPVFWVAFQEVSQ